MQTTMKAMYSTFNGLIDQIERMTDTASAMGQVFDDAKSDDYFYLPPEAVDSPDFQRGLKLMLSPDGKSAQFIIAMTWIRLPRKAFRTSTLKCRPPRRPSRAHHCPTQSSTSAAPRPPTRTSKWVRSGTC